MTKTHTVQVRVTEEEVATWRRAAGLAPVAAWIRHVANGAARGINAVGVEAKPSKEVDAPPMPGPALIPGVMKGSELPGPARRTVEYDRRGTFDQTRR